MQRIFLFAGYDPQGVIGKSLLHYVSSLSVYGDVIVVMDSDCAPVQMQKLSGLVLYSEAQRHGEYDFGSYKRAFQWAEANLSLAEYDFCYLVNDSVFGPFRDLGEYLTRMESGKDGMADAFAFVMNPHNTFPHLQSWFIGFRKSVFMSEWFRDFIHSISRQDNKGMVCNLYETGLSVSLKNHGYSTYALYNVRGKRIYNNVISLYKNGLPYVKKSAFTRHNGALGLQVKYILDRTESHLRNIILQDACRIYGKDYVRSFLTGNLFKVSFRYSVYLFRKLKTIVSQKK